MLLQEFVVPGLSVLSNIGGVFVLFLFHCLNSIVSGHTIILVLQSVYISYISNET